jgi:hypothetical protein
LLCEQAKGNRTPKEEAMTRYVVKLVISGLFVATGSLWTGAAAQDPRATTPSPSLSPPLASLDTPHALRMEDRHLREDLAKALADQGAVGAAAREIERILLPHLEQREQSVFRPLGLLNGLARDESGFDAAQAIALTDQIERELPGLVEEHRALYQATKRFTDAANREHKLQYLDLADRLWVHVRLEEEVLYPTVILVGRYLKMRDDLKHRPATRSSRKTDGPER